MAASEIADTLRELVSPRMWLDLAAGVLVIAAIAAFAGALS